MPRSPASETVCPSLVDQRHGLWRGPVEDQALAGRRGGRRGGRGRATGGEQHAESEGDSEDGEGGSAGSEPGQASSSPGGRNVKGRSASVISVEAIQRVRSSKTGTRVDGSSSCCSLKRSEPS